MARPNLSEIARRLNVSKGTVSRVFNDTPNSGISPATRRRILSAIREMGYEPNLSARALARGRTNVIGALIINVTYSFASGYVLAMEAVARAVGYHVILCNTRGSNAREHEEARMLRQRGVEGLIVEHLGSPEPLLELAGEGFPFVLLDRCPEAPELDYVTFDDVAGGRLATAALAEAGRRRIAHVAGPANLLHAQDRLTGYGQVLAEAGLEQRPEWVVRVERMSDYDQGRQAALRLFDLPERPDAIFCACDYLALGVFLAAAERGVRIPQDTALVGYDDEPFGPAAAVPLASVRLDTSRLGEEAARLLLAKIEQGAGRVHGQINIEPQIVRRASLGTM